MPSNNQPEGTNAQQELFGVDRWGVHKCAACGALGTIVAMNKCCSIARLVALDIAATKAKE